MPTYFARKAGNINAADVWATTPSGTAAAVTFAMGDILMANSFAIAVNVSTDLGGAGQVRNDTTGGATAGGSFALSNGVTLTANVFAGSVNCVTYAGALPNSATITGNVTGSSSASAHGAVNSSGGTLNINGTVTGGSATTAYGVDNTAGGTVTIVGNVFAGSGQFATGVRNNSVGTINVTGNVSGATGASNSGIASGSGILNITGNVTGGSNTNTTTPSHGVSSSGTTTIVGNCTGGTAAANHGVTASGGLLTITGNCIGGGATGAFGANASGGSLYVTGSIFASEFDGGVSSTARNLTVFLTGPFYTSAAFGVNPNRCVSWRWNTSLVNTTFIEVPTSNLTAKRNLVTPDNATNFPAPANVRSGTTFGIEGALVGTCAVPLPAQVAPGVSIDNTIGTLPTPSAAQNAAAVRQELAVELARIDAAISSRLSPSGTLATVTNLTNAPASVTPSDIWSHASRTVTGGTVDTLTNAPSVPSAAAIASQVRTELSVELARVDAAITTRATPANIPAADITAIKAKTDAINVDRINNTATLSQVGNLLAQANS